MYQNPSYDSNSKIKLNISGVIAPPPPMLFVTFFPRAEKHI